MVTSPFSCVIFLGVRRAIAAADFNEDVVQAGQRQFGMVGQHALALRVDLLGEVTDAGLLLGRGVGEGECFKAAGFVVARIIAYA